MQAAPAGRTRALPAVPLWAESCSDPPNVNGLPGQGRDAQVNSDEPVIFPWVPALAPAHRLLVDGEIKREHHAALALGASLMPVVAPSQARDGGFGGQPRAGVALGQVPSSNSHGLTLPHLLRLSGHFYT